MPVSIEFENEGIGVLITGSGNTEAEQFIAVNNKIYAEEVITKLRYQLVDMTGIDQVDTSIEKIRTIAEADKAAAEKIPGLKIAIVVSQELLKGFAEIYTRIAAHDQLQTKIFSNVDEARRWISECIEFDISA